MTPPMSSTSESLRGKERALNNLENSRKEMRQAAKEAIRRLNADRLVGITMLLQDAKISPYAHIGNHPHCKPEEYLLSVLPDLVSIALDAHYALLEEVEKARETSQ